LTFEFSFFLPLECITSFFQAYIRLPKENGDGDDDDDDDDEDECIKSSGEIFL